MVYSYLTPKANEREDAISGQGSFAIEPISKGEIVFIKGGYILTRETMLIEKLGYNYWPLSDELFLAPKKDSARDEIQKILLRVNHSCNPNCGLRGEITGIALRDIEIGEELTMDYAMLDDETDEAYNLACTCGEANCRGIITGQDWRYIELQERYKGYFAAYLQEKIDKQRNEIETK
ncbi:SET domain-containing protein [Anaerosporobacter sp.]|uniref:SET domain-containing protein n=1 Tax=Anaerosporobacter sp. TaxID=1872529 RepID=UPI00286F58D5|nr:SET domain-containing protein [Anaerosporobacter sp.]